jgi:hypothetical protein
MSDKRVLYIHSYKRVDSGSARTCTFYEDGTYNFAHWGGERTGFTWRISREGEMTWSSPYYVWKPWVSFDSFEMARLVEAEIALNKLLAEDEDGRT